MLYEVRLLGPDGTCTSKHVYRTGLFHRIVGLVAVDSDCPAVLEVCRHRQSVAVCTEGDQASKLVVDAGIRGLQIGLPQPAIALTREDVNGP